MVSNNLAHRGREGTVGQRCSYHVTRKSEIEGTERREERRDREKEDPQQNN